MKQVGVESKHAVRPTALFDRAGWKIVRFGAVVERNAGKVDRAALEGTERWVAGDHIDEGDLHIRRESFTDDPMFPPTFRYTFEEGNVLLHSRNPKKVALAHFDGITGEKLFVLRPKDEQVLSPKLLPFILLSDHFQRWAVENSSGSVNKFLNWSALERYEFALPPLDQQRRIAELLWAVDANLVALTDLEYSSSVYAHQLADALVVQGIAAMAFKDSPLGKVPTHWQVQQLHEVCERISVGIASSATHAYVAEGVALIRNQNIREGFIDDSDLLYVTNEFDEQYSGKRLRKGDVLTARTGYPGTSAVVPHKFDACQSFTTLISRTKQDQLLPEFLCLWMNSRHGKAFVNTGKAGGAQQNLNAGTLEKMLLPIPPLAEQQRIVEMAEFARGIVLQASSHRARTMIMSIELQDSLLG
jgi:type I restriction enzyme S subunit